jgi:hypothetical protein
MADPQLPFILAGPILRRVEPRLVAVWMALSEPRALQLNVFQDRQQTGTGKFLFLGDPLVTGAANTARFGARLHVGVVVAEIGEPPKQALKPGLNYSYNVLFAPFAGNPDDAQGAKLDPATLTPTDDLKKRGLLLNDPVDGRPHKALGYDEGELPGFALPPEELTDLRLLHGSCRRPGFAYVEDDGTKSFDAVALIDDLILEWRRGTAEALPFDANVRPHQLFFTGDQIYADDVESPMLPMLNRLGRALIGGRELLPTRFPPEEKDDKAREAYVNAPKPLPGGFKTLQEFVDDRRGKGQDPLAELKQDRRIQTLQDPCFARSFQIVYPKKPPGYKVDDLKAQTDAEGFRHWEVDLVNFPAALRTPVLECEAQFSTSDTASHLMSFGEFCAMYLAVWCNAVWEVQADGKPRLATVEEVYAVPPDPLPQLWELTACFPGEPAAIPRSDRAALDAHMDKKRKEKKAGFETSHATLTTLYDSLPRVRRALANVPTYMVFDDHDVTDDWNLGRAWRDRVFTSHMGRHILTNALVAYVAFQDWGNDPRRYREPPFSSVLKLAGVYQPTLGIPTEKGSTTIAQHTLQTMFGLDQPDPEDPAPQVKWHYTIDGPRHRVVVLDTRTRRHFPSRYLPAGLLSAKALADQLPAPRDQRLPPGVDVLVVISQTPPVLPAVASRVLIPVMTKVQELEHHAQWRRLTGLEPDNEIWPGEDVAYTAFLRRLAEFKKVVVLSGEVHYASAGELTLWTRGLKRLDLPASLEADLNTTQKPPMATPRLLKAFRDKGFNLSGNTCVQVRPGNGEWLVVDVDSELMFLVRKEVDGLNVYEEELPARLAQFVSSGLKNVKKEIVKLGRLLGFAFPLTDLTPAERLIWDDNTPEPVKPPADGRFPPAIRDNLGKEPVVVPAGNWPPGTTLVSRPDASWRADAIQDRRPDSERPEFTRPDPLPEFDPQDVEGSYSKIAKAHSRLPDKYRFTRGVLTQSNVGLIRFELDEGRLVARQDLVSHPPGKNEAAVVSSYRIPLEVFGLERPKLTFDLPVEENGG